MDASWPPFVATRRRSPLFATALTQTWHRSEDGQIKVWDVAEATQGEPRVIPDHQRHSRAKIHSVLQYIQPRRPRLADQHTADMGRIVNLLGTHRPSSRLVGPQIRAAFTLEQRSIDMPFALSRPGQQDSWTRRNDPKSAAPDHNHPPCHQETNRRTRSESVRPTG